MINVCEFFLIKFACSFFFKFLFYYWVICLRKNIGIRPYFDSVCYNKPFLTVKLITKCTFGVYIKWSLAPFPSFDIVQSTANIVLDVLPLFSIFKEQKWSSTPANKLYNYVRGFKISLNMQSVFDQDQQE